MFKDIKFIFNLVIIIITAVFSNFYFGSIGAYPIDSFAFFDSAYAVMNGTIPFKDYWVMNGAILDFFQAIIFYVFGVNWQAYLLHSSIVNAIFGITSFLLLKNLGLNQPFSLFYAICISLLSYPIVGVPFPDHHSILFSYIGVYALIFSIKYEKKRYWFLLPIIFFIAFFSKQAPAGYFIILLTVVTLLYSVINKKYNWVMPIATMSLILFFFIIFFLITNNIKIEDFFIQYFLFPTTIGEDRFTKINFFSFDLILKHKLIFLCLLILLYIYIHKINNNKKYFFQKESFFVILFICSILIAIFHQSLTKNQIFIYFLIPLLCGFCQSLLDKDKNFFIIFLLAITLFGTIKYHFKFNIDRKFMELENVDLTIFEKGEDINNILKGLKWTNGEFTGDPKEEVQYLKSTIQHLKNDRRKFIIITNYQFILSSINKNSFSPNRWYTVDGVSYPLKNNKYHVYYKKFYNQKLKEKKIEVIYTILPLTIETIDFVLKKDCFSSLKINPILFEHRLKNCF